MTANFIRDGQDLNWQQLQVESTFALPPPRTEQQEIADSSLASARLPKTTSLNIERSLACRTRLSLVHEYRTRLITDVVTGKLDVREAAASLPEVDLSRELTAWLTILSTPATCPRSTDEQEPAEAAG